MRLKVVRQLDFSKREGPHEHLMRVGVEEKGQTVEMDNGRSPALKEGRPDSKGPGPAKEGTLYSASPITPWLVGDQSFPCASITPFRGNSSDHILGFSI